MKIEDEIHQKKFRTPLQKAVINILFTSSWLSNKHQSIFKPFGITSQQFNILRILKGQHPKTISASEIKARMLDQNSDVSRMLDRLVAKSLIDKKICPRDKRAADVSITEGGLLLLKEMEKIEINMDETLCLTASEATLLSDLLDKCRGD